MRGGTGAERNGNAGPHEGMERNGVRGGTGGMGQNGDARRHGDARAGRGAGGVATPPFCMAAPSAAAVGRARMIL